MPLTYANTYGELLTWFVTKRNIKLRFEILKPPTIAAAEQLFIPPSPAITHQHTTVIYPFTGLFEGLNLNCGRGTATPFCCLGAPWIDAQKLHRDFLEMELPGITAVPHSYVPQGSVYAGEACHGLFFKVSDPLLFRPVRTGLRMMNYFSIAYPQHLQEQAYPTVANPSGRQHLDRLLGVQGAFQRFCNGSFLSDADIRNITKVQEWISVS
jgi:uncharacterized protein YbbC (DUF1343 family)